MLKPRLSLAALLQRGLFFALLLFPACSGGGGPTSPSDVVLPGEVAVESLPQLVDTGGMATGLLGLWSFESTGAHGAVLSPIRLSSGQGDLFQLSVRPFMLSDSLKVTGSVPVDADTVDYTLRFKHPFAMPTDLTRPATAAKRADLFLFDVNLVLIGDGSDRFFDDTVVTNLHLMENASGYRAITPMLDPAILGITEATHFPYRLITRNDVANPIGNYDAVEGWVGDEFMTPTGYDVIPQGSITSAVVRGPAVIPPGLAVGILAKYMDPRSGANPDELRSNRLPDPENPAALRYYLPEACGDLQELRILLDGELTDSDAVSTMTVRVRALDWDHAATIAGAFPDAANPTHIAQDSTLHGRALDVPALRADSTFSMQSETPGIGIADQYVDMIFNPRNIDLLVDVPFGETQIVDGLVRAKDRQDLAPRFTILLEDLTTLPGTVAMEPSTRYQYVPIPVKSGKTVPTILSVTPEGGRPGEIATFGATTSGSPATGWSWDFGGGATPNTSTGSAPEVLLGAAGTYDGTVTATNAFGTSAPFPFTIVVAPGPVVVSVDPAGSVGITGETATFSVTTQGGTPTGWQWDFGGGASPNTSIANAPEVTLGAPGSYVGEVTVSNEFGPSPVFSFPYSIEEALPPVITFVAPTGKIGMPSDSISFSAIAQNMPTAWSWNFGGGASPNTSTAAAPDVSLGNAGTYSGTVTAANDYGVSTAFPFSFTVSAVPEPPTVLSVTPNNAVAGEEASQRQFTSTSTNSPTLWSWNFGGGASPNTSSASSPTVVLGTPGFYQGTLTVSNGVGPSAPFPFTYSVSVPPAPTVVNVTPTGQLGNPGGSVQFNCTTGGLVSNYAWNFGGGTTPGTSTQRNPLVSLGAVGNYQGSLIVSNSGGASAPFPFSFSVAAVPQAPVIQLVTPTGTVGKQYNFIDFAASATNSPTSWSWNFGGGCTPNTSTVAVPNTKLNKVGTWTGTVTATNAVGTSPSFQFEYTIGLPDPPVVTLVDPTGQLGIPGSFESFDVTATNLPTDWSWNFGGGCNPNIVTSDETPSVLLGTPGDYVGTVIASNAGGDSEPFTFNFSVANYPPPVISKVNPGGYMGIPGATAQFFPVYGGNVTSWSWDFGGGTVPNNSTDQNPIMTLGPQGDYVGTVVATGPGGSSAPKQFTFTVGAVPPAKPDILTISPLATTDLVPGQVVTFSAAATNAPTSWSWDFGALALPRYSAEINPTVTVVQPGYRYAVNVTATNVIGSDTAEYLYDVTSVFVPTFTDLQYYPVSSSVRGLAYVNDRIELLAYVTSETEYHFLRALTDTPTNPKDFLSYTVSPIGDPKIYNGRWAGTYYNSSTGALQVRYATQASPTNATQWVNCTVVIQTNLRQVTLTADSTSFHIAYYKTTSPYTLYYARSNDLTPTTESDWTIHTVRSGTSSDIGYESEIALIAGRPAIAHWKYSNNSGLGMAYASSATPTASGDWALYPIDDIPGFLRGEQMSFGSIAGHPMIAYTSRVAADAESGSIKVAIAETTTPVTTTDWNIYYVEQWQDVVGIPEFGQDPNGWPLMDWHVDYSEFGTNQYHYARPLVALPANRLDWKIFHLNDFPATWTGYTPDGHAILAESNVLHFATEVW